MPAVPPPGLREEDILHLGQRAKTILRQRMRQTRSATPKSVLEAKSAQIVEHLRALDWVREARSVGLFWPLVGRGEVDLRSLDVALRRDGKRLFYPFMRPKSADAPSDGFVTGLGEVSDTTRLEDRGRGFLEPPLDSAIAQPGELDVICVPALAASADLFRLGYGAGYYDATLPDYCPPARAIVTIFDFQLLAEIPVQPHDVRCDAVITETRLIRSDATPG